LLRSGLKGKPYLRKYLTRCRCCRIFFLTDRRNAWWKVRRCPYGCGVAHRKRQSTLRSVAYYQDKDGREKKKDQNAKRKGAQAKAREGAALGQAQDSGCAPALGGSAAKEAPPGDQSVPHAEPETSPCPPEVAQALPKAKDPALVEYVRRVVSLIERRRVSLDEIWEMLARILRQHMIVRRKKIDQVIAWLKKDPP
jgi:hypothetical protein